MIEPNAVRLCATLLAFKNPNSAAVLNYAADELQRLYALTTPLPFESAPRGGRLFLAWYPERQSWFMAHYSNSSGEYQVDGYPSGNPTLWLPLPEAPKEKP
jgi:hypothetical protein